MEQLPPWSGRLAARVSASSAAARHRVVAGAGHGAAVPASSLTASWNAAVAADASTYKVHGVLSPSQFAIGEKSVQPTVPSKQMARM